MTMISNRKRQHGTMGQSPGMMGQGGMKGGQGKMMTYDRRLSMMTEGYLYWTISEGGEALETAMPAFKDVLSEKERWQVILLMSNGFQASRAK